MALEGEQAVLHKLVLVEWEDSAGCASEWTPLEGSAPEPFLVLSVGWVLHADKCLTLVPHRTAVASDKAPLQGCGDMTIPRSAIRKIIDLSQSDHQTQLTFDELSLQVTPF